MWTSIYRSLAAAAAASVCSCSPVSRSGTDGARTVVLVSIDGFGADYFGRHPAPHLEALASRGVRARWMEPVFPVKTFPNHYTIVTGLYPAHHGIVSNNFVDPVTGLRFRLADTSVTRRSEFWGGEPLWVTAVRQGRRAATFFWPGSDVAIRGVRPTMWKSYDGTVSDSARVDTVLAWLALPSGGRPSFIALYFSAVDDAGHAFGPASAVVASAVLHVDSMLGRLVAGIGRLGLSGVVDVIVVSDHGMTRTSPESVVVLDDLLDTATVMQLDMGPLVGLEPRGVSADSVLRALRPGHHVRLFHRDSTPPAWRYRGNPRIPQVVGVADDGWLFTTRRWLQRPRFGGEHGYDPRSPGSRAIFVAAGPSFREGLVVAPFSSVHIYELLCRVLGLTPARNDGSVDSVIGLLR